MVPAFHNPFCNQMYGCLMCVIGLQNMKGEGVTADKLQLLRNVSGAFRPGVLTALMGVSGAGKTTLMDVLAGRKTGGYIEGDIRVSGYPKVQETFARVAGYVEQSDIHSPQVTVHESLIFSSWLRLPKDVDDKTREVSSPSTTIFLTRILCSRMILMNCYIVQVGIPLSYPYSCHDESLVSSNVLGIGGHS